MAGELEGWAARVAGPIAGLRLLPVSSFHITLAFLGDRPADEVLMLGEALTEISDGSARGLALGDPWWLPRRRPGVLAVAVADDHGELRELQGWLVGALRQAMGFEPEARLFFPHVTVARVRREAKLRPHRLEGPAPVEFEGTRVSLFRSRLGVPGGSYEALASVELALS